MEPCRTERRPALPGWPLYLLGGALEVEQSMSDPPIHSRFSNTAQVFVFATVFCTYQSSGRWYLSVLKFRITECYP